MPELPVTVSGVSTSRRDFVRHDLSKREGERLIGLKTNKVMRRSHNHTTTFNTFPFLQERHSKLAVELKSSVSQDKNQSGLFSATS